MKAETILPFIYYPHGYQLPLEAGPLETKCFGHLLKWTIELSQFDIEFMPRPAIKGQVLADFITEFTTPVAKRLVEKRPEDAPTFPTAKIPKWGMYVDGSSNEGGLGAGLILVSLEGHQMHYALRFGVQSLQQQS